MYDRFGLLATFFVSWMNANMYMRVCLGFCGFGLRESAREGHADLGGGTQIETRGAMIRRRLQQQFPTTTSLGHTAGRQTGK
jgi:hypothetical protein